MTGYIARRIAYLLPVLVGVSLLAYSLINLAPGDPARIILQRLGTGPVTDLEIQEVREDLGLDDPFPLRYARWMGDAVRGDLGTSYRTGQPVRQELWRRLGATLEIAIPGFLLALAVGIPAGTLAAMRRNRTADHLSRLGALVGASIPSFWLAYLLILLLAVRLGILPVTGRGTLSHLVMPTIALSVGAAAGLMRLTRASVLEVLGQDHMRTAKAYGLRRHVVVTRYALRNALIPVVTLAGLRFGSLLGGAVIIETIFAWPGLGRLLVNAVHARDYPVVEAGVFVVALLLIVVNTLVDLSYARLNPKVSLA